MFRQWRSKRVLLVAFHLSFVFLFADVLEIIEPGVQYKSYKGHQLLRVFPSGSKDVDKLISFERDESKKIDFWQRPSASKRNVDILVGPEDEREVKETLSRAGLKSVVLSGDVQKLIDEELTQRSESNSWTKRSVQSNELHKYQSFSAMMEWLDGVKTKCAFCQVLNIGKSSEGRDLKVVKISKTRKRKPAIFMDAGFHAREWIAPATALNFIDALTNDSDPVTSFLTREYDWYIMPLANPDGYLYSWTKDRLWRKTRSKNDGSECMGTDLNRNWNFYWGGEGTSRNSCRENFCGSAPFSEPESRSIAKFILGRADDLVIYLSLHSYGQLILAPWGHSTHVPQDFYDLLIRGTEAAEAMRKATGAKYSVGSAGRTLYLASGASDDWVKGVAKVKYSFTIELRDTGDKGFLLPESEIPDTALEATNGIIKMSFDVLRELKRFGSKDSIVFRENATPVGVENPTPIETSIDVSLKRLNDPEDGTPEERLHKEHAPSTIDTFTKLVNGMESFPGDLEESRADNQDEENPLDSTDETMKHQLWKHHFIVKQFQQEILKQNSKYKVSSGNLFGDILRLLDAKTLSLE